MQVKGDQLLYFHEYPAVSNATVGWSTPTLRLQEIREYRIVRENAGPDQNLRAYCRLFGETEWTQLTVNAVTPGTGVGTLQATIPAQGGGSSTNLSIDNTGVAHIKQVLIYNAAIDP